MRMRILRFCGNTYDPRRPDAGRYVARTQYESEQDAVERHMDWLHDKMIGDPQRGSGEYNVERLKLEGSVGVYSFELDEYAHRCPEHALRRYGGWLMRFNTTTNEWETVEV